MKEYWESTAHEIAQRVLDGYFIEHDRIIQINDEYDVSEDNMNVYLNGQLIVEIEETKDTNDTPGCLDITTTFDGFIRVENEDCEVIYEQEINFKL